MDKSNKRPALAHSAGYSVPEGLVPPHVQALEPYRPGRPADELRRDLGIDRFVNLASNENPLGPPTGVMAAIHAVYKDAARYPEIGGFKLRRALADRYAVGVDNVAIGSGAESIMANIVRAFLHGDDEVVTSNGTFIGFYVLVRAHGVRLKLVPLKRYGFDLEAIADSIGPKTKIVYLCNPNSPTGTTFTRAEFDGFMKRVPAHVLIILDEAYVEFAGDAPDFPDSLTYKYDNVLTLRTFSKAYGMAGLRLGYGLGHDYLIGYVNRIKLPFEPNIIAQAAGLAVLADDDYLARTLENNRRGMRMLVEEFSRLGLPQVPSWGNFIMVDLATEENVNALYQGLLRRGVAIRPLKAFGLPHCIRITVGLPDENTALVAALRDAL